MTSFANMDTFWVRVFLNRIIKNEFIVPKGTNPIKITYKIIPRGVLPNNSNVITKPSKVLYVGTFSVQVFLNGITKTEFLVPQGTEPINITYEIISGDTYVPFFLNCSGVVTKPSKVAAYMLYVEDIQIKYETELDFTTKTIANELWWKSPQKPMYQQLAESKKKEIEDNGYIHKEPVNGLSAETCRAVEEVLDKYNIKYTSQISQCQCSDDCKIKILKRYNAVDKETNTDDIHENIHDDEVQWLLQCNGVIPQ